MSYSTPSAPVPREYAEAHRRICGRGRLGQTIENVVAATVIAEESTAAAPGDSLIPMIVFTSLGLAAIVAYGVSR